MNRRSGKLWKLVLALVPGLALVLGGCATIDSSMLERAQTLEKGKFEASAYSGSLLLAHSFISNELYQPGDPNPDPADVVVSSIGFKLSYGLNSQAELIASSNLSKPLYNGKLGLKYRLGEASTEHCWAIMPAVYYSNGEDDASNLDVGGSGAGTYIDYRVVGFEMPVLHTWTVDENLALTFCAKGAFNVFDYQKYRSDNQVGSGTHQSLLGALIISPSFKVKGLIFTAPELGLYYFPVKEGGHHLQPTLSFGLSLEL